MPGPPQARVADMHTGPCTMGVPMPIMPPCAVTVLVGNMPAARVTDLCTGMIAPPVANFPPHPIAKGSMTVLIQKMPAARIGDLCSLGGAIVSGMPTVLTGG
ncbi:MAG: PAAR domain-containing protein [Pseudomonadota bacterium]